MGGHCHLVLLPLAVVVHGAPGCPAVWPGLHPHCHFVAISILALPFTLRAVTVTPQIYVEGGEGVEWEQLCKICQAESGMTNFT